MSPIPTQVSGLLYFAMWGANIVADYLTAKQNLKYLQYVT